MFQALGYVRYERRTDEAGDVLRCALPRADERHELREPSSRGDLER